MVQQVFATWLETIRTRRMKMCNGLPPPSTSTPLSSGPTCPCWWTFLPPIIHDLAAEYKGRAIFVKVDVDQAGTLAARYKVSGIPDVRIFREGKPVAKIIGLNKPGKYRAALDAAIVANNGKETKE